MKKLIIICLAIISHINSISVAQNIIKEGISQPGKLFIVGKQTDINKFVKQYVESKISVWQKKGEFEKTTDYQKRVNEQTRNAKIQTYTVEAVESLKKEYIKGINWKKLQLNPYDAENETFLITSSELGDFTLPVDIETAPDLRQNWSQVKFQNIDFYISNNKFVLAKLEIINPAVNKKYIYDKKIPSAYEALNIQYNFEEIEVDVPNQNITNKTNIISKTTTVGKADVDVNIPVTTIQKTNAYALIIGNEDYTKYQPDLASESNVEFARNDATIFAQYCEKTLGIPKKNITLKTDIISSQMRREIIRFTNKAKYGGSNVELIFYYSGHGFPDSQSKEAYLMPVDISGNSVTEGIKLLQLYKDLTEYPCKRVTVFLDACFSGGGREQGLLAAKGGVKIKPKENVLSGNLVVFSASSGNQESLFYREKGHGMFTYFLLKKLQETLGNVTYGELSGYLKQKVQFTSSDVNYKVQNPEINISSDIQNTWSQWKIR